MGNNLTRFRTLDRLARDPRVLEIWDEGRDGLWLALAPGFTHEDVAGIHAYTVRDLLSQFRQVKGREHGR